MAVARIRTSDPEVVEFLSRHLASSGYQLEFVRPGEPAQGEADLEIDASRMDLESAMAAARQEPGLITVLSGVLRADTRRDIFEEAAQTSASHEYAEVSPYARGAELHDEPSTLHKTANAIVKGVNAGASSVGNATKAMSERFETWRTQRAAHQEARRQQREREMVIAAAQRRQQEARRAEEEAKRRAEEERRRAEEERLAAIRREEITRLQAEERRRREEQERIEAEAAQVRMEEERRARAEAAQRRVEEDARRAEQARLQAEEEERRRQEDVVATGIERQRQEEESCREAEQQAVAELAAQVVVPEDAHPESAAAQQEALIEATSATVEDSVAEPEPEWTEASAPAQSWSESVSVAPRSEYPERRRRPRRIARSRERVFKRSAVAAAIVAVGVISVWSLGEIRRPANPLSREQLMRSAAVEQQRPFGPAATVAPVTKPEPAMPLPQRRSVAKKPTPRGQVARPHPETRHVAKRSSSGPEVPDVVVHHFASHKQETAKVKVKNGVKIISESD